MKSSPWMIFALFIIHIAGILFLLINSVYSLFNRKTKRQKGNCCKIGSDLAFTLLFLYHTSLIILALFSALLCQFLEDWKEKIAQNNLVDIFIICGGVNYDCVFYSYFRTSWNIEAFSLCMFLTSTKLSEWSSMERRAPAQGSSRDQCI